MFAVIVFGHSQARDMDPYIPKDLTDYIVEAYVTLRQQDLEAVSILLCSVKLILT